MVFSFEKTESLENSLQSAAIRKRRFIVYVQTTKTDTFENNDITAYVELPSYVLRILNRQVVAFSNRRFIYVWTG